MSLELDELVEKGMQAIFDTYVSKESNPDEAVSIVRNKIKEASAGLKGKLSLPLSDLDSLIETAQAQRSTASLQEVSRRSIARWFEVPLEEFEQTPTSQLEAEVLFHHLYYETKLADWFTEWGYDVAVGEELEGSEGADFTPDLFATLDTLHGNFAVAVCLVCDSPPSHYRTLALLENIEAYTRREKEFSERDVLLLVTPFKFLGQTDVQIRIQSQEEAYFVIPLEGDELQDLDNSRDSASRMHRMRHYVQSAAGDRPF